MKPIIIMPTYNEAENITRIIPLIQEQTNIDILIIDDNSPDNTGSIVETLQKKYNNIHLIKRESKKGLASAYITGFKWALNQNFNIFIQMDADFQHPIQVLPEMLRLMQNENIDVLIGSRYINNGGWEKGNRIKEVISRIGNIYSKLVLNSKIKDITGGYNIWSKKALTEINLNSIISTGYMFQIEMKYKAEKKKLKIKEFPIKFKPRVSGNSKMDIKICLEAFVNIWKLK